MTQNRNLSILADNVSSAGVLTVAGGGTGLSTTPSNGQLNIGNGTGFTRATLTQGTGITVTNGAGTITIAATNTSSGTVTSITAGTGLSGGTITTSGTIALVTTYAAVGTYAFLARPTNQSITTGTSYAGSGLTPASNTGTGGSAPAGTWQAMGAGSPGSCAFIATVMVRIA